MPLPLWCQELDVNTVTVDDLSWDRPFAIAILRDDFIHGMLATAFCPPHRHARSHTHVRSHPVAAGQPW
jgi:hypothetical protein